MFKLRQGLVFEVSNIAAQKIIVRQFATRIRPQVPLKNTGRQANNSDNPNSSKMLRLLAIMGGLAVASFFIGPAKAKPLPLAAKDSLKRRVVVIFVVGDSGPAAAEVAKEYNCVYVRFPTSAEKSLAENVTIIQKSLAPHVSAGTTRFLVDGIPSEALPDLETRVVDPDLVVSFGLGPVGDKSLTKYLQSSRLVQVASKQELDSVLKERNMD